MVLGVNSSWRPYARERVLREILHSVSSAHETVELPQLMAIPGNKGL